jgi:hypothetical protein
VEDAVAVARWFVEHDPDLEPLRTCSLPQMKEWAVEDIRYAVLTHSDVRRNCTANGLTCGATTFFQGLRRDIRADRRSLSFTNAIVALKRSGTPKRGYSDTSWNKSRGIETGVSV